MDRFQKTHSGPSTKPCPDYCDVSVTIIARDRCGVIQGREVHVRGVQVLRFWLFFPFLSFLYCSFNLARRFGSTPHSSCKNQAGILLELSDPIAAAWGGEGQEEGLKMRRGGGEHVHSHTRTRKHTHARIRKHTHAVSHASCLTLPSASGMLTSSAGDQSLLIIDRQI